MRQYVSDVGPATVEVHGLDDSEMVPGGIEHVHLADSVRAGKGTSQRGVVLEPARPYEPVPAQKRGLVLRESSDCLSDPLLPDDVPASNIAKCYPIFNTSIVNILVN